MFRSLFTLLAIVLTGSATLLSGQESLSLSEAIERGLANNFAVKIAETDLEMARNSNDWAVAGRYPTVNLTLNNNNGLTNLNNPVSFLTEINSFSTGLTPGVDASLVLFDGYRVRFTKAQLEQLERQSRGDLALAVEATVQNIILAYYQALLQREQLAVLDEVLELSRDRINYQEVRKDYGQAVTFDLLQSKDALYSDSTNYLVQANAYRNALRSLNLAMGESDPNREFVLTDALQLPEAIYDLEAMREKLETSNRQLQNALVGRELAQLNTRVQEATKYPRVTVGAATSYNYNISSGEGALGNGETLKIDAVAARTFNFGLNFGASYRLFDGGARRINIENARLDELRAEYTIGQLKQNLGHQLETTYATYRTQLELVGLTEALLDNARENLRIAGERLRGGLINSFDYRSIQLGYINASQSRLNAINNLKATETELIRLIGGLVR